MKSRKVLLAMTLGLGLLSTGAQATLIDNGDGTITDTSANPDLMWLKDANYAATELTDARRDIIIAAINAAAPSWLGGHTMVASDF